MGMTKRMGHHNGAALDMTSMLDIVFILIIFFVVTASFTHESGVDVDRPTGNPPSVEKPDDGLLLQLASGQRILYRGYAVDVGAATSLMKKFHVEHSDQVIVLKLEDGAQLGLQVTLLDRGRLAGLPKGSIAVI